VKECAVCVLDLSMQSRDGVADLGAPPAVPLTAGKGPLPPAKGALVAANNFRIRDDFPAGEDGEMIRRRVDADLAGLVLCSVGCHCALKADIPTFGIAAEDAGFYLRNFGERAVHMDSKATGEALELEPLPIESDASEFAKTERFPAVRGSKARKSCSSTFSDTPEVSLIRIVDTLECPPLHLVGQSRKLFIFPQFGQGFGLVDIAEAFPGFLVADDSFVESLVIELPLSLTDGTQRRVLFPIG
jgi:hypothetical protein